MPKVHFWLTYELKSVGFLMIFYYFFGYFVLEIDKNTQQMFQQRIDPLYIGPD